MIQSTGGAAGMNGGLERTPADRSSELRLPLRPPARFSTDRDKKRSTEQTTSVQRRWFRFRCGGDLRAIESALSHLPLSLSFSASADFKGSAPAVLFRAYPGPFQARTHRSLPTYPPCTHPPTRLPTVHPPYPTPQVLLRTSSGGLELVHTQARGGNKPRKLSCCALFCCLPCDAAESCRRSQRYRRRCGPLLPCSSRRKKSPGNRDAEAVLSSLSQPTATTQRHRTPSQASNTSRQKSSQKPSRRNRPPRARGSG